MAESSEFAGQVEVAPGRVLPGSVLSWSFVTSGGPGGQNVNKVASKAVLSVDWEALATVLPVWALDRLRTLAGSRATDQGLVIASSSSRSQLANRRACLVKLRAMVVEALNRPRPRRATRPSRGSIERRLAGKQHRGAIKRRRQGPADEPD